jgi:hypothetical protein
LAAVAFLKIEDFTLTPAIRALLIFLKNEENGATFLT